LVLCVPFRPGGQDCLRLLRGRSIGFAEDFFVPFLGLAPQALAELERLSPRVPEDPLPLRCRAFLRASNLTFRGLDSLESFLFLHARTSGTTGPLLKGFRPTRRGRTDVAIRARRFSSTEFYTYASMQLRDESRARAPRAARPFITEECRQLHNV